MSLLRGMAAADLTPGAVEVPCCAKTRHCPRGLVEDPCSQVWELDLSSQIPGCLAVSLSVMIFRGARHLGCRVKCCKYGLPQKEQCFRECPATMLYPGDYPTFSRLSAVDLSIQCIAGTMEGVPGLRFWLSDTS